MQTLQQWKASQSKLRWQPVLFFCRSPIQDPRATITWQHLNDVSNHGKKVTLTVSCAKAERYKTTSGPTMESEWKKLTWIPTTFARSPTSCSKEKCTLPCVFFQTTKEAASWTWMRMLMPPKPCATFWLRSILPAERSKRKLWLETGMSHQLLIQSCLNNWQDSPFEQPPLRTQGSAGPSGIDVAGWRRVCTGFHRHSSDLCSALARCARPPLYGLRRSTRLGWLSSLPIDTFRQEPRSSPYWNLWGGAKNCRQGGDGSDESGSFGSSWTPAAMRRSWGRSRSCRPCHESDLRGRIMRRRHVRGCIKCLQ